MQRGNKLETPTNVVVTLSDYDNHLFTVYVHFNEHNGARKALSLGVAFARGAAEVVSFTFSILLVTMCYNMVRFVRETVLNLYIPFDKNIVFHKIVAWTALAFTGMCGYNSTHCNTYNILQSFSV